MLVDEVKTRIEANVSDLASRIEGALELGELIRQKALPQSPVAAFVLPLGLRPRDQGEAVTGAFIQNIDETVAVLLVVRSAGDVTGRMAIRKIEPLVDSVINAVSGWGPEDEPGVFRLTRGALLPQSENGTNFYQLDFSIHKQIRVN